MRNCFVPVPIGSIPEVPAESCEEIKASEGEQGKRGSYWLNTIKPGIPERVYCHMNEGEVSTVRISCILLLVKVIQVRNFKTALDVWQ